MSLKRKTDLILEAKDVMGPTTLIRGKADKKTILLAAGLTARYSDSEEEEVIVKYKKGKLNKEVIVDKITEEGANKLRI